MEFHLWDSAAGPAGSDDSCPPRFCFARVLVRLVTDYAAGLIVLFFQSACLFVCFFSLIWFGVAGRDLEGRGQGTGEASGMPGGEDVRKVSRQDIQLVSTLVIPL